MASEIRPRRRRDSLGPNPFRLGSRAQREVAKEESAARSPSSLSAPPLPTAPQAVPAPVLQAPPGAIEPPPPQENRDPIQRTLSSGSNSEAVLGILVAGPRLHTLPPESPSSQAVVAPQATPAPLYQASTQSSRPRRAKKKYGPSLLNPSSSIEDDKATLSPTWFLPYPNPSSVPTSVLEGLLRSGYLAKDLVPNAFPLHPRLKRELQFEKDRRSQVWLSSPLGRLPAEIRVMIYEHVLTAPPSQSPITVRGLSEEKEVDRRKAFAKPSSRKVSPVAILQTCRLVYQEAQDTYYASNAFHTRSAQDLHTFLLGIGLARCEVLTTLHIEGLLIRVPMFTEEWLDREQKEGRLNGTRYETLAKFKRWRLGSTGEAVSELLEKCKRLRKVHLLMGTSDERSNIIEHVKFARDLTGEMWKTKVDFIDGSHWVVRLESPTEDWYPAFLEAAYNDESRAVLFPRPAEGQQRCVEVDIRMDLKVNEM